MNPVDVIVSGREASEPPALLQTLASPVTALRDHPVQARAVINLAAEVIDPADGSAPRRSARGRRQAAVAAGRAARVEEDSSARRRQPYPSQRLRVAEFPRTRREVAIRQRAVGHWLEPADDLVNADLTDRHPTRPDRTQSVTSQWTRGYPRQVGPAEPGGASVLAGLGASTPVNHRQEASAPREIPRRLTGKASRLKWIPLTRDYTPGRWRRARSPQPLPDVTLESEALATARRRLA